MLVDSDRPTIVKERMLGSVQSANRATQQLLRVDQEAPHPLSPADERALTRHLERELARVDGVLDLGHQQGSTDAGAFARG